MVDFGHEREPSQSLRVNIEEVVYVDPRWKIELVRATIPQTIAPLMLAVRNPDDVEDLEAVLIGYPGWDIRNEATLMQRLFRGATDIKRLLPGYLHQSTMFQDKPVLAHDCTSTGGCGGAPLIDLETGEVLGIHFAGQYLKMNYAVPAAELSTDPRFARAGVRLSGEPFRRPARELGEQPQSECAATGALEKVDVSTPNLTDGKQHVWNTLEHIVIFGRPVLSAINWRSEASDQWEQWEMILGFHGKRIDLALRAVGKLLIDADDDKWTGTAFLVGERLALTTSFVTSDVVKGVGVHATLKPGTKAAIDFREALGTPEKNAIAAVTAVRFIHPFFQLALLELDRMPNGTGPLALAAQLPAELAGRAIVVLSFSAPRIGQLCVQPGTARQVGQMPDLPALPALIHDCTTMSGSAGAPVLDLGTGYVIGVQTHTGGYAQATWEFARDPHVWPHPITLLPDPRPPWLNTWDAVVSEQPAKIELQPRSRDRWTVDDVPIDWTKNEPKELERLLVSTIDAQMAMYAAENVGVQLGSINPNQVPVLLWRSVLKNASTAGVLRLLLEGLAAEPQHAGIAPKLRAYL